MCQLQNLTIRRDAKLLGGVGGQYADISSMPQGLAHGVMEDVLRVLTLLNLELVHLHGAAALNQDSRTMECTSSGVVPVVKPSVGRRGGVGWGLVATGFLQSSHAATRINPRYRLGTNQNV